MDARDVHTMAASVTVWLSKTDDLHEGTAIEYIVEITDGQPSSAQRAVYHDGEHKYTGPNIDPADVPWYVRNAVEQQMIPKGSWE
jgi:hypothetical protein